ncbi:MAG: hypothetical protein B7Y99_13615 [Caulobacterales bacterium 32-69-10]|nr:MAG: hypothetical protein B7Y99_13615 [Caulobacterales bacterium 32-69-10]
MGDVLSNQTLNVESSDEGVSAEATAVGNIVSATGQNAYLNFQSNQALAGATHVEANATATVTGDAGPYFTSAVTATGNSATAGTCCALTEGTALQTVNAGAVVAGDAIFQVGSADAATVESSAVGNTTGWQQINGAIQTWTGQTNSGLTTSTVTGEFAAVPGNTTLSATAVSNNVTVDSDSAPSDIGVGQIADGDGASAVVDVVLGSAGDIQALATGVGNNVDAQHRSPESGMGVSQGNSAPVTAYANLEVTDWTGDANVVAYGVGNSVVQSNNGPRAVIYSEQYMDGDVNVAAGFTGGAGANVFTSATAIGNAVSGYACSACGGSLEAFNNQVGSSRVRANSAISVTGRARSISGQASAVGNSATYEVSSGN